MKVDTLEELKRFLTMQDFLNYLETVKNDIPSASAVLSYRKQERMKFFKSMFQHLDLNITASIFVPKPFTPFQWFPMENVETLKTRQKWLKKALNGNRC